jgi:hypothetical protein
MTHRHLTIASLIGLLFMCALAATAVVNLSGAALPEPRQTIHSAAHVDVRVGDGVFRLRIHAGDDGNSRLQIPNSRFRADVRWGRWTLKFGV